jgi:hypothetical protein
MTHTASYNNVSLVLRETTTTPAMGTAKQGSPPLNQKHDVRSIKNEHLLTPRTQNSTNAQELGNRVVDSKAFDNFGSISAVHRA